jgi:hypothetical protein
MNLSARSGPLPWLALILLAGCRSSLGGSAGPDAPGADAAAAPEAAVALPDAAAEAPPADAAADVVTDLSMAPEVGPTDLRSDSGQISCGAGTTPAITGSMEHLVVTPEGTIYYSSGGAAIGRIAPGKPDQDNWVRATQIVGLTYDPRRRTIYAGLHGRLRMLVVKLTVEDVPDVDERPLGAGAGGIYGMTLGEDGAVYYLDEWNGSIYRADPDTWTHTQVVTGLPGRPHALAFGPDGWLYVTQTAGVEVWRVRVEGGKEVAREKFATVGFPEGRGIAFDEQGRLYVTTEGRLTIFDRQGKMIREEPSSAGGLDFGAGHLPCTTLYVAAREGLSAHQFDIRGMNVPWHRTP